MQLFKGGYRTMQHLAHADPKTLSREIEHLPRRQAELIVCSAKVSGVSLHVLCAHAQPLQVQKYVDQYSASTCTSTQTFSGCVLSVWSIQHVRT